MCSTPVEIHDSSINEIKEQLDEFITIHKPPANNRRKAVKGLIGDRKNDWVCIESQ